jgi:hypothetical protein
MVTATHSLSASAVSIRRVDGVRLFPSKSCVEGRDEGLGEPEGEDELGASHEELKRECVLASYHPTSSSGLV